MTYREILQLYKKGQLDEKKRMEVEQDIEKQDAISEYLFENASDDIWDEIADSPEVDGNTGMKTSAKGEDFTKEIQKSIRKAFLHMGIAVGITVLAIVAFCAFALPEIVDRFYYDPGKIVDAATGTNQMSLDMEVYTELNMPFARRDYVDVEDSGFGNYDIYIPQTWSYSGTGWHNVVGNIKKNKVTFYDANVFCGLTGNAFDWFQVEGDLTRPIGELIAEQDEKNNFIDLDGKIGHGFAGGPENSRANIDNLKEGRLYKTYFTLNRMMSYEEFMKLMEDNQGLSEIWCAVKTNDPKVSDQDYTYFQTDNIGFNLNMSCSHNMGWDKETYPKLVLWNGTGEEVYEDGVDMIDPDVMKTHVVSMLRYMEEQDEFCRMMEVQDKAYGEAADFIEKNGLTIYGFTAVTDKNEISKWFEKDEIYSAAMEEYY